MVHSTTDSTTGMQFHLAIVLVTSNCTLKMYQHVQVWHVHVMRMTETNLDLDYRNSTGHTTHLFLPVVLLK